LGKVNKPSKVINPVESPGLFLRYTYPDNSIGISKKPWRFHWINNLGRFINFSQPWKVRRGSVRYTGLPRLGKVNKPSKVINPVESPGLFLRYTYPDNSIAGKYNVEKALEIPLD
jgi:hypothetical protein